MLLDHVDGRAPDRQLACPVVVPALQARHGAIARVLGPVLEPADQRVLAETDGLVMAAHGV